MRQEEVGQGRNFHRIISVILILAPRPGTRLMHEINARSVVLMDYESGRVI